MQQAPPSPRQNPATWTLTDGHAGNVRQAEALAAALGREALAWTLQVRAPWRWASPRCWPGAAGAFGDRFAQALAAPPVLAIGCGRQAALATRLLRQRGAKAVQILDPRIAPAHWDLVIAPQHDELLGANVISVLGSLHPVDDLWLAAARHDFPALGALPGPRTALLLGGASAHATFDMAAFDELVERVARVVATEGGSVLVTTSRRTPAAVRARLRERFGAHAGVVWTGEDDDRRHGGRGVNPYAGLLGWADRIVCTADSVNMLSEAAATNAPLFVAGSAQVSGRPRRFLDRLLGLGRARPLDETLAPFAVTPLRETARVAAEVQQRLFAGT